MSADLPERAWDAYLRQELSTSAAALADAARVAHLFAPGEFDRIRERAERHVERVAELESRPFAERTPVEQQQLRHDLRGGVGYIVSAVEDLCECETSESLAPDLAILDRIARAILDQLLTLLRPDAPNVAAQSIRDTIAKLPSSIAQAAANVERTEPGRVLVVDDNEYSRELLVKQLRQQGHSVRAVAGAAAALDTLEAGAEIDVVVTDVLMPDISGLDLLKTLKADARFGSIPVILVSALGDEESVLAGIGAGAEDYWVRPVRSELARARLAGSLEKKRLRDREQENLRRIDKLVRALFPPSAVEEYRRTGAIQPRRHDHVGVLFADIVGFTAWCERYREQPEFVVETLQSLVRRFETTAEIFGVQKIKTIGDAFLAVAGLSEPDANPAATLLRYADALSTESAAHPSGWRVRIGIHVGPVVTGILGQTQFGFDIWGQTVNAAARMESNGIPGRITLSAEAWAEVETLATGEARTVEVKGLGEVIIWDFVGFRKS